MDSRKLKIGGDPTGINIGIALGFSEKLMGLMFSRRREDYALLIPGCSSIHTFFMFFPIDAVFLDSSDKIIRIVANLKPWRAVLPVSGASKVLELPVNSAINMGLKTGDTLEIS